MCTFMFFYNDLMMTHTRGWNYLSGNKPSQSSVLFVTVHIDRRCECGFWRNRSTVVHIFYMYIYHILRGENGLQWVAHQMFINLKCCASIPLEGNAVKFNTALTVNGSIQCKLWNLTAIKYKHLSFLSQLYTEQPRSFHRNKTCVNATRSHYINIPVFV
jgi:hypothetical protein